MLALAHRFHGHNSLRPLYQKGKSVYSRNLKMLSSPLQGQTYRVAVVVSKKVHKSAVVRNRIRRRLYGLVQDYFSDEPSPVDIIFLVQNEVLAVMPTDKLQEEVIGLLKKIAPAR